MVEKDLNTELQEGLTAESNLFGSLLPHQKDYVVHRLVSSMLSADPRRPISVKDAHEQLQRHIAIAATL